MSQIKILTATALCASFLAGCSTALNDAKDIEPTGSEFARELHKGYVQLAQRELDENDFADARAFALRASSAGLGNPEPPEGPDLRQVPPEHRAALERAYQKLQTAFKAGASTKAGQDAARAQLMLECWAQEQEENFQTDDIAACRRGFDKAMASLSARLEPQKASAPTEARIVNASVQGASPGTAEPKTKFTVLFDFDDTDVKEAARQVINQAIDSARVLGATAIKISGHADRAGATDYNRRLSEKRAGAVAAVVKQVEGSTRKIETKAMGEDQPAVETPDGIKEPRNRRVEIIVVE